MMTAFTASQVFDPEGFQKSFRVDDALSRTWMQTPAGVYTVSKNAASNTNNDMFHRMAVVEE